MWNPFKKDKSQIPEYFWDANIERYILTEDVDYYSKRYDKHVILKSGDTSDGATGAIDIRSLGWWVHDELCESGVFSDGSRCSNWQASWVLSDILRKEGRLFRSVYWHGMTFFFGGEKLEKF